MVRTTLSWLDSKGIRPRYIKTDACADASISFGATCFDKWILPAEMMMLVVVVVVVVVVVRAAAGSDHRARPPGDIARIRKY